MIFKFEFPFACSRHRNIGHNHQDANKSAARAIASRWRMNFSSQAFGDQAEALTRFASLEILRAAVLLWITPFFAALSMAERAALSSAFAESGEPPSTAC